MRALESITNRVGKWRHTKGFAAELEECMEEMEEVRMALSETVLTKPMSE